MNCSDPNYTANQQIPLFRFHCEALKVTAMVLLDQPDIPGMNCHMDPEDMEQMLQHPLLMKKNILSEINEKYKRQIEERSSGRRSPPTCIWKKNFFGVRIIIFFVEYSFRPTELEALDLNF